MSNYDNLCRHSFKNSPNTTISWFLIASYCYYIRYESILSDEVFDKMCKWMYTNYESLNHEHKHLVTKDMLKAGTGFNLKYDNYPLIVRVVGEQFIRGETHENNLL